MVLSSLNSLIYFTLAAALIGLALYISPQKAYLSRFQAIFFSKENGKTTFLPLLSSIVVSFILTLLLKIFQG